MNKKDILIVDDENDILTLIADALSDEGYTTRCALTGATAVKAIERSQPSLVILDIWLKDRQYDGLKVLSAAKAVYPHLPIIMMSGHGTIETAVKATKMGAYDFLEKPFKLEKLLLLIQRALEASHLARQLEAIRQNMKTVHAKITGNSPAIERIKQTIKRVAPTNSRVFITGEPGTGKDIMAQYIHEHSLRASAPFIVLNCALLGSENFEEQLFGTENTHGDVIKTGKLEHAHQGTLLLDEVLDLPLSTQAKLSRTLHDMRFQRSNGERLISVDVRILATTSTPVEQAVHSGAFRKDLFYRLNVVPITMPTLQERQDDIPEIVNEFMEELSRANNRFPCQLTQEVFWALKKHLWPGNITQLRNMIEWLVIMHGREKKHATIQEDQLPIHYSSALRKKNQDILKMPLKEARERFEQEYLQSQINRFSGNVSRTASFIGMERSALHRKLKQIKVK